MTFQALLVSKDEEAAEVLTSVLSGFGVAAAPCSYSEAMGRVTDQKFDALIVDFDDPHSAALILRNASQSSSGANAVTVALLTDRLKVRNALDAGANFVLYKPISPEHAEAGLRAATALIKRERRRSYRVAVQVPIQLRVDDGGQIEGILLDLSEDGMDVLAAQPLSPSTLLTACFTMPDGAMTVEARGEVARANSNGESGVRFLDLPENLRNTLKTWVAANAPELPPQDPEPVEHCKLSDLSLGGCYVETESPFPERSGVTLCLKAEGMEVQAEGVVRVMHPAFGMGIEFASRTAEDHDHVTRFIEFLTSRPGTTPQLLVTPRALSAMDAAPAGTPSEEIDDPLLELLRNHESYGQDDFLQELRKQRGSEEVAPA